MKKSKVVVIVIIAVILSLFLGGLSYRLIFGGGGSGSAAISHVYVCGETEENEYGGEMTEKEDFWAMFGAARTALIDDGKVSQMKFAE